jgi:hypothetical protein
MRWQFALRKLSVVSAHKLCLRSLSANANKGCQTLDRAELIDQAGIESIFVVEGTEDDLPYFAGEEYGND